MVPDPSPGRCGVSLSWNEPGSFAVWLVRFELRRPDQHMPEVAVANGHCLAKIRSVVSRHKDFLITYNPHLGLVFPISAADRAPGHRAAEHYRES